MDTGTTGGCRGRTLPPGDLEHEVKAESVSPGNLFVFSLGMDEVKTIREREGRINYMVSSFNLTLKENPDMDRGGHNGPKGEA